MRLVRDDDYVNDDDDETTTVMAEPDPQHDDIESRRSATAAAEEPDGAVAEADDDTDSAEDAGNIEVNLGLLEALLLSTHHPLTAGKLAELLDLAVTKPIRAAIKSLNE